MTPRVAAMLKESKVEHPTYEIGEHIGPYVLDGPLDETKNAEIYCGENTNTGQLVAVKALKPGTNTENLRQEIGLHSRVVNHPNVVDIDGFDVEGDQPYLATNLQEAGSLLTYLKRNREKEHNDVQRAIDRLHPAVVVFGNDGNFDVVDFDIDKLKGLNGIVALRQEVRKLVVNNGEEGVIEALSRVSYTAKSLGYYAEPDSIAIKDVVATLLTKTPEASADVAPDEDKTSDFLDILTGVTDAVAYMHAAGITADRDVKLGNFCLDIHGRPKKIDFGTATTLSSGTKLDSVKGSMGSIPLEGYEGYISNAFDNYGLACIAYIGLTGMVPSVNLGDEILNMRSLMNDRPPVHVCERNSYVPEYIGGMIMDTLSNDPEDRFTAQIQSELYRKAVN